jgi:hypothetical protein
VHQVGFDIRISPIDVSLRYELFVTSHNHILVQGLAISRRFPKYNHELVFLLLSVRSSCCM